jgi:hypothetical protein
MGHRFYQAVRILGAPFSYRCIGGDKLKGPAILVANHLGVVGPIQVVLSIPQQLHLWGSANLLDKARIVDHLMGDFVVPVLHLRGRFGKLIAKVIGRIVMPMLDRMEMVPVDRYDIVLSGAFKRSMQFLEQDGLLLVMPEDPTLPMNPVSGLHPFMSGYLYLCSLVKKRSGQNLPVFPVAIHKKGRSVVIGDPLYYENTGNTRLDMLRMTGRLEKTIERMLMAGIKNQ